MGVKAVRKQNRLPQIQAKVTQLANKKVKVGLFDGDMAWLGSIHEYGCTIPVTPKMRAWLHYHGIHLKASTETIVIPERSFLRGGFTAKSGAIKGDIQKQISLWVSAGCSENTDALLAGLGAELASIIKTYAVELKSPAKSEASYVLGARSSNPLVETGEMINRITYHIE